MMSNQRITNIYESSTSDKGLGPRDSKTNRITYYLMKSEVQLKRQIMDNLI